MIYAIHDDTGAIHSVIEVPPDALSMNVPDGMTAVAVSEMFNPSNYYIQGGNILEKPPSPGPWAMWENNEWVDPRTADDFTADLMARRSQARLSKVMFLLSIEAAGILSTEEMGMAGRGEIPPSFAAAFAGMGDAERVRIEVIWRNATVIERLDPFIMGIAASAGISDEMLDAVFGVSATGGQ